MRTKIYYLFLALIALLLMSCGETARTEKDSVLEYDVIEIDSCEYIITQPTGYDFSIKSIAHKGNCKYCKERSDIMKDIVQVTDTVKYIYYEIRYEQNN